ncbi:hypothetical protein PROFUN_11538 [Planoprotostelium fungivorum]|uniref:Uncharacterized protein n=1 Tax=Planoprotostelium fungivorum TaxID=1890364 RepID=A0A2P6NA15_9EUKA|nr:hypothetical protein PROFUN_11538 [Planoprotostelium fungivorum]
MRSPYPYEWGEKVPESGPNSPDPSHFSRSQTHQPVSGVRLYLGNQSGHICGVQSNVPRLYAEKKAKASTVRLTRSEMLFRLTFAPYELVRSIDRENRPKLSQRTNRDKDKMTARQTLFFIIASIAIAAAKCTDCGGYGVCMKTGACRCYPGRINPVINGTKITSSCIDTVLKSDSTNIVVLRVITAIFSLLLLLLISWRIFLEHKHTPSKVGKKQPVVMFSLVIINFITFLNLLLSVLDYWGVYDVLPVLVYHGIYYFIDWLFVLVFCGILLDWAELYSVTMKAIRSREMMKKVHTNMTTELSLEEIMTRITFIQRFKIPFIVTAGLSFLVWVARVVGNVTITDPAGYQVWFIFTPAYYAAVWLGFGVAFCIYGYRLIRVMPQATARTIRTKTIKMVVVLFLSIAISIQQLAINSTIKVTSQSIILRTWLTFVIRIIVSFVILEMYMPVSRFNSWFHLSLADTTGSNESGNNGIIEVDMTTQVEDAVPTPAAA